MKDQKEEKKKMNWGFAVLGALMVVVGTIMIVQGISAYKTGALIPATTKSGPMTGLQSIITGIIAGVAGLSFVGVEVFKAMKRSRRVQQGR
ncbi:MAG: hypothetical protein M0023_16245 [Desulfobacteraceae bacterium]|nr:hypothetical protein [Desulfobacteraceae bacterium]